MIDSKRVQWSAAYFNKRSLSVRVLFRARIGQVYLYMSGGIR